MRDTSYNKFGHNFAIWVMGRRPGFFKPQRYKYLCMRCKWSFILNDEYRGSIRVCLEKAGAMTTAEAEYRLRTFESGPCPGSQSSKVQSPEGSRLENVIPMRREHRL